MEVPELRQPVGPRDAHTAIVDIEGRAPELADDLVLAEFERRGLGA
jgi:hypothetical protein